MQGVKLYYGVLEAMLVAEESRTQRSNFTSLLTSNYFHKCLAACAFQLVVAAYKMVSSCSCVVTSARMHTCEGNVGRHEAAMHDPEYTYGQILVTCIDRTANACSTTHL